MILKMSSNHINLPTFLLRGAPHKIACSSCIEKLFYSYMHTLLFQKNSWRIKNGEIFRTFRVSFLFNDAELQAINRLISSIINLSFRVVVAFAKQEQQQKRKFQGRARALNPMRNFTGKL